MTTITHEHDTDAPAPAYELYRLGSYVGTDIKVVIHLWNHTSLQVKELVERCEREDGNADIAKLLNFPVENRHPSEWEIRTNGIDEASAAMETFVDELPFDAFIVFMEAHPDVRGELSYENCSVRGSITFGLNRKMKRDHRELQWWSQNTGYRSVPYFEFVALEGNHP
jgi:hypothetical protein